MQYLKNYQDHQETLNEGIKNWLATFLVMANLGLAPLDVKAGTKEEKKEFVESQPQDKIDAALFINYLSNNQAVKGLSGPWSNFISLHPEVKSKLGDVQKYISQDGKKYVFDKQYTKHNFQNVNIWTQMPDNYLNDWGNFIPDEQESNINNLIDEFNKKTSVEICILTVDNLGDEPIDYYALDRFNPGTGNKYHDGAIGIGIGKKYADDGILIVLAKQERKIRITTGYGIESFLTDIQCKRIIDNIMTPHFKKGEFYDGVYDAVKEINEEIGNDNIQIKKDWLRDKKMHDDIAFHEAMVTLGNYFVGALLIGAVVGGILLIKRKRRLKREAAEKERKRIERLHSDVDATIQIIERLKGSLPTNDVQSKSLLSLYEKAKKIIQSTDTSPEGEKYSDSNLNHLKDLRGILDDAIGEFKDTKRSISSQLNDIKNLSGIKLAAMDEINQAVEKASKIERLGYKAGDVPKEEDLNSLDPIVSSITSALSTDVDLAIQYFKKYKGKLEPIYNKSGTISTKLSNIEGAIEKVKNWKKEIAESLREFNGVADSSEKRKAKELQDSLEASIGSSKDWIALASQIDSFIKYLDKIVHDYKEAARRKREEEEEEERRRRRRQEEEEESRRSSYSSSSSSSSSFGGFGGGSSGGGGASGGW